jgi:hypothetical protein
MKNSNVILDSKNNNNRNGEFLKYSKSAAGQLLSNVVLFEVTCSSSPFNDSGFLSGRSNHRTVTRTVSMRGHPNK